MLLSSTARGFLSLNSFSPFSFTILQFQGVDRCPVWNFYYYYFMPTKGASPSLRLQTVLGGLTPMLLPEHHELQPPVSQPVLFLSDQMIFILRISLVTR